MATKSWQVFHKSVSGFKNAAHIKAKSSFYYFSFFIKWPLVKA